MFISPSAAMMRMRGGGVTLMRRFRWWPSLLQLLLGIIERRLEGGHLDAGRAPTHHVARHPQQARGVAEGIAALQAVCFRKSHVLERDLAVLHDLERDLVFDLLDAEARRGFVLDDEAFDLIVGEVARPDDRDVAPRRVANPALLAVEDPGVAVALGGRGQAAARARTDQRLGEAEA